MGTNSRSNSSRPRSAAFLWDESFLWGVMAYKALSANGLAFDLLRSDDVRKGKLKEYPLLFVPGGWASNKMKALGDAGIEKIRMFVRDGGNYVGFCGGAGLATLDGIGLVPVKRKPTKERVPSFSGRILLNTSQHPIWEGISDPCFHAWWPSQFVVDQDVSVLATYGKAMPDSFSSDLNVGDTEAHGGWAELERMYRINLDPKRLVNEPAVLEGRFGAGKVVLSLVHFDTPDDRNGVTVLGNVLRYLQGNCEGRDDRDDAALQSLQRASAEAAAGIVSVQSAVGDLIALGQRNFLWYWRNPLLLQWRRGVRGLEYCTLYIMVKELAKLVVQHGCEPDLSPVRSRLERVLEFTEKAKHLLVRERHAMQSALITYERCNDPEIRILREELFSQSKSHGGLFKKAIDGIDQMMYDAIKQWKSRSAAHPRQRREVHEGAEESNQDCLPDMQKSDDLGE